MTDNQEGYAQAAAMEAIEMMEENFAGDVEQFMQHNRITQLTYTGPIADGEYHTNYSAIIGDRHLFGERIADILEKAR